MKEIKFQQNLKVLMRTYRYTQEKLAEKCNVSRQTVGTWCRGESVPSIDLLMELKDIFDITLDELVCGGERIDKAYEELLRLQERVQKEMAVQNNIQNEEDSLWKDYVEYENDISNLSSHEWVGAAYEMIEEQKYESAVYCLEKAFIAGDVSIIKMLLDVYWDLLMIEIYGITGDWITEEGVEAIPILEQCKVFTKFGKSIQEYGRILIAEMERIKWEHGSE